MKPNQCACGELLMTRDEMKRAVSWSCAGFSRRLAVMDNELASSGGSGGSHPRTSAAGSSLIAGPGQSCFDYRAAIYWWPTGSFEDPSVAGIHQQNAVCGASPRG